MQIGSANSPCGQSDLDFTRTGLVCGCNVFDSQIEWSVNDD